MRAGGFEFGPPASTPKPQIPFIHMHPTDPSSKPYPAAAPTPDNGQSRQAASDCTSNDPTASSGVGGKAGLNGDGFACHSSYRVRYRRTFGDGLALDPLRNSDISSEILPNRQRIYRPRALTVIKFDPGKFHTVMSLGKLEFFRLRAGRTTPTLDPNPKRL